MPVHMSQMMKKKNSMNERIKEVFFREDDEEALFLRPIETGTLTRMGGDGGWSSGELPKDEYSERYKLPDPLMSTFSVTKVKLNINRLRFKINKAFLQDISSLYRNGFQ